MALNSIAVLDLIPVGERDEEALFARDEDDALIRRDKKTQADFIEKVKLTIDGVPVTVPRATPVTDAQGNTRFGPDGKPIPRATTIYDAASEIVRQGVWSPEELTRRIPVLCHQEHVSPVAVCRMCSVHVSKRRRRDGKLAPGEKLVPACQHEAQAEMVVTTRACDPDGEDKDRYEPNLTEAKGDEVKEQQLIDAKEKEREDTTRYANQVNRAIRILTELLVADHHHPDEDRDGLYENELLKVAAAVGVSGPRAVIPTGKGRNNYVHPKSRPIPLATVRTENLKDPYSARTISVDHDRCILCDRCVRACSEVRPFKVIGHTGKGYYTRISFDLDLPMDQSSCVQCGECMTSCPTGALTLKRRVSPKAFPEVPPIPEDPAVPLPPNSGLLTAQEMRDLDLVYRDATGTERPFFPFRTIPFAYLKWNEGAVRKRQVKPGDVLCRQGEYGATAFLVEAGSFEVYVTGDGGRRRGLLSTLFGSSSRTDRGLGMLVGSEDQSTLILGELAVLSNKPRAASIVAATDGVVYEVTRNLFDMAQRSPSAREVLAAVYRRNAVRSCLRSGSLFASLNDAQREVVGGYLDNFGDSGGAELRRVPPGEVIVAEGDLANDFYIIRLGFVKVARDVGGREDVLARLAANDHFGELGLLADHPEVRPLLPPGFEPKRRTATVTALDPVEVVRIPGPLFRQLCDVFPDVEERLADGCAKLLAENLKTRRVELSLIGDYLEQGLFQGQRLLVLDLESCTRCDECTRACADSHGDGISRLLREGMRFGSFLVATSCRSCHKPYCMDGCPVDAIHRAEKSLEVLIDSHCIGCGLCSQNCPYGAIQLVPKKADEEEKGMIAAVAKQAVNCDLCHDLVPQGAETFCVAACPHEAAFRWDGETLLNEVTQRLKR